VTRLPHSIETSGPLTMMMNPPPSGRSGWRGTGSCQPTTAPQGEGGSVCAGRRRDRLRKAQIFPARARVRDHCRRCRRRRFLPVALADGRGDPGVRRQGEFFARSVAKPAGLLRGDARAGSGGVLGRHGTRTVITGRLSLTGHAPAAP
jgi:hypothetical protein